MSYLLRLQQHLKHPERLPAAQGWIALEAGDAPAILAFDEALGASILKSRTMAPLDMLAFASRMLGIDPQSLPNLAFLFEQSRIFQSGPAHLEARTAFAARYREIEQGLSLWLPHYCRELIAGQRAAGPLEARSLAEAFVIGTMTRMIAHDLRVDPASVPIIVETFFTLRPTQPRLRALDAQVGTLMTWVSNHLQRLGRPAMEAAMLVTLQVIGREPLEASLVHGLLGGADRASVPEARALFADAAAVNMIGRYATADTQLGALHLREGQMVYVSPHLMHWYMQQAGDTPTQNAYAFGKGAHTCLGQMLSVRLASAFFEELARSDFHAPAGEPLSLRSDLILKTLTTAPSLHP